MKNNPKVSIIIPTYNMANLLYKCVNSLINQTLQDIEIIIVDDASTDNTENIVKEFNDKRIKYIKHTTNRRRGGARNTGLENARGEYIGWVDADDWIESNMYELMYNKAIKNDCDIVQCNYFTVTNNKVNIVEYFHNNTLITDKNIFESFILKKKKGLFAGLWNKIYKRELFISNNIQFPITYHEDGPVNIRLAYYAKKLYSIKEPLYYYLQHENNTSDEVSYKSIEEIYISTKTMYDFLKEQNILEKYKIDFFRDTFFRRVIGTKLNGILYLEDNNDKIRFIKYQIEYIKKSELWGELNQCITNQQKKLLQEMMKKDININRIKYLHYGYKQYIKNNIKSSKAYIFFKKYL